MKYFAFAIVGALARTGALANECVYGDFILKIDGHCNYTTLLLSFTEWFEEPGNVAPGCSSTAEQELLLLLNTTDAGIEESNSLCRSAIENGLPFETSTGKDARFVDEYYKGNGDWNEQVASETGDDRLIMELKNDAKFVDSFRDTGGRESALALPDLPNFESCSMNAAYCCWPKDRQAGDKNGNCAESYDSKCVDSDPGDNTDLCFVDHAGGAMSTGLNTTEGWFAFPFDFDNKNNKDNLEAEGPIHCHGFAWADDFNDPSYIYRGNNLFFVSLYDHMYQRGYVGNIPGAPMCACAEQMPTVSRADCTQIDFANQDEKLEFVFTFKGGVVSAELVAVPSIEFNACQGLDARFNKRNNDLWSYMNRLFVDDKVGAEKLEMLTQKLVGDNNCPAAERKQFAEKGLSRGYNNDDELWVFLGGREALDEEKYVEKVTFNYIINASSPTPSLLRRACASCYYDQQWLYYRRISSIPETLDLWSELRFGRSEIEGNIYGKDFLIYGSYEDAINDTNEWKCVKYQYSRGFPGDCGPNGTTRTNQGSCFNDQNGRSDVAWFAENNELNVHDLASNGNGISRSTGNSFSGLVSTLIGRNDIPGSAYTNAKGDKLFVSASGKDIWGESDDFRFTYENFWGDMTLTVKISALAYRETWTKAGLMIRDSLAPGAKYFSVLMTGHMDVTTQYRKDEGGASYSLGHQSATHSFIWLKITKRLNLFRGFKSFDGENWVMVGSQQIININSNSLMVGMAVTSHHTGRLTEVQFEEYENEAFTFPSAAPSASPAPSFALDALDIGNYNSNYPSNVYVQGNKTVVEASGRDIWNQADSFTFINHLVEGDFDMAVRVTSNKTADAWTKMGLMVRDSLDANAKHLSLLLAPHQGVVTHVRRKTGEVTYNLGYTRKEIQWTWLRIKKQGTSFTLYQSLVGSSNDNEWYQVGNVLDSTNISFNRTTLQVGIAVTSHNWAQYAIGEFEDFSLSTPAANTEKRGLRGGTQ